MAIRTTYFSKYHYLCTSNAAVAQLVEHWLPKPRVAGSSPVCRSILPNYSRNHGCHYISNFAYRPSSYCH